MRVDFSEIVLSGIRREFPDASRQMSCVASLRFYLRRDHGKHSVPCHAFDDLAMYIYPFGNRWRVLYAVHEDAVTVWSFLTRSARG